MLKLGSFARYWHTLRHLKRIQFYARIKFKLFDSYGSREGLLISPPQVRPRGCLWRKPIPSEIFQLGPRIFRFLNKEHELLPERGWQDKSLDRLWLYNLHYFADLNAKNALARIAWHQSLISEWIAENPPTLGTGWEPYPTSLRIVNWVKWALTRKVLIDFRLPDDFDQSLATQTRWLMKRLEWHLLGNHLFANAKALVFSGLYFQGVEANIWLRTGLKIISSQLDEQVLNDGGNYERSTMYHAIFLEDLLDLINLSNTFSSQVDPKLVDYWCIVAKKMLSWLKVMSHPDGKIAFFNDAAFGIASSLADLEAYSNRLEINFDSQERFDGHQNIPSNIQHLKDSGYIRMSSGNAVALLDVAPIGPDYLPGHAHADTLSFEMSLFNQRVIVNGGTSRYGLGPDRLRERQTVAHSTVEINSLSSSEVWGGFRVARRAYPFDLELSKNSAQMAVSCSHDGYKYLLGRPVHRRSWLLRENAIEIRDAIQGSYSKAIARFILHPDIEAREVAQDVWDLRLPQGDLIIFVVEKGAAQIERAFYAPEFGKVLSTRCLAVQLEHGISSVHMRWS